MMQSASPLGYIEYALNPNESLHLFDPMLPRVEQFSIHDHTYDQTARVLHGRLAHTAYDYSPNPAGNYTLLGKQPWLDGGETVHELPNTRGDLSVFETLEVLPGNQFQFQAGWFHELRADGFTIVHIFKTAQGRTASQRFVSAVENLAKSLTYKAPSPTDIAILVQAALPLVPGYILYA